MKKFLNYILNYRRNVLAVEQLKNNLSNIHGKTDFQLILARAASIDLWNQFRGKK